jgi:hypothetical protein
MNKQKILVLVLIILGLSLLIGNVSAATKTCKNWCQGGDEPHKTTWTVKESNQKFYDKYVKKNGVYYKKYINLCERTIKNCTHKSHDRQLKIWGEDYYSYSSFGTYNPSVKGGESYTYIKAKKGDVLKKSSPKYVKTTKSNGKIYKMYSIKKTVAASSKKLKTTTSTSKKIIAYYKTYKMPKYKSGGYNWGYFKGNSFTYGNSFFGYYVNHLNEYGYYNPNHRIYKISPKTWDFYGTNMFYKKPTSFTLYARA